MTPEMTQTALAAVAEETVKAAVKRSLTITMVGSFRGVLGGACPAGESNPRCDHPGW